MKTWKMMVCLMSLVFLLLAVTACEQSGAAKVTELRGAIQKDKDSNEVFIRSGGRRYYVESEEDLSAMAGKMVTMTGTVSKQDDQYRIVVNSVKEDQL